MSEPITLEDQIRAVERAARGIASADIRAQTRALMAAAGTLHVERTRRLSAEKTVADWMIERSYATGHGDTVSDMLIELEWQAKERGRK